eukprot:CAMPEP_0206057000 /NCGR_PEP_ID=MMETSP1466-20131121/43371_1 /ASSEMBLY_ACC=CAM_ASM_001126 /TAXON_ID=44452 /ORGANISM="Pavlova gyrans, Strain CCMP608" /LENGTH=87 /DNA_ID=CAMNT_0053432259 /DNA_START=353 /DNA_END=613 /DNA_ORIENTATION=+
MFTPRQCHGVANHHVAKKVLRRRLDTLAGKVPVELMRKLEDTLRFTILWCFPVRRNVSRPEPLRRKRFFAADFVRMPRANMAKPSVM